MRNLIFYASYYEAIKELPDEEQGKVYKAIIDYAMMKIEPDLSGIAKAIFVLIKPTLDASIKNYENGKKGGRPPKESETESEVKTQTKTQVETQNITQQESETESDIIFEKEKEKKNENDKENLLNKENSLPRVKESETSSHSTRTQKHRYGNYKNVLLTEEEYERLIAEPDGAEAIEYFSEYREMKGYKCKNDNLAIRKWAFNGVKEQRQREAKANNVTQSTKQKESPMEQLSRVLGGV